MNSEAKDTSPNGEYPKWIFPYGTKPLIVQNEVEEASIMAQYPSPDVEPAKEPESVKEPVKEAGKEPVKDAAKPKFSLA